MWFKIRLEPAFLSQCELELKWPNLLAICSASPETALKGAAFHAVLAAAEPVQALAKMMLACKQSPTPKKLITICDGLQVDITYADDTQNITLSLTSIQPNSPEEQLFRQILDFAASQFDNQVFSDYIAHVKWQFLRYN